MTGAVERGQVERENAPLIICELDTGRLWDCTGRSVGLVWFPPYDALYRAHVDGDTILSPIAVELPDRTLEAVHERLRARACKGETRPLVYGSFPPGMSLEEQKLYLRESFRDLGPVEF